MATRVRIKLDYKGIGEVLKSNEMADMVSDAAEKIQSAAQQRTNVPVVKNSYTTDRAAVAVTLASDSGLTLQARDGVLTKAAGTVGAEVTEK